jgi:biotin carboxyl carrier protein
MALDRPPGRDGPVASVSEPGGVRVALGAASGRPDIPAVVVQPPVDPVDDLAPLLVDGSPAGAYRVERTDTDRLVIADDADPPTRTSAIVAPWDPAARHPQRPRRDHIERLEVLVDGWRFEVEVEPAGRAALREKARRGRSEGGQDGPVEVRAIIPGVVVAVSVAAGDQVTAGQQLLVVEAMKMQNELRSPRDGVVGRLAIGERQTIEVGDLLVVIE